MTLIVADHRNEKAKRAKIRLHSISINKSIKDLNDATGHAFKETGKRADYRKALKTMTASQKKVMRDVAQRAFRLGVRRGALQALEAVLDRDITVHGKGKRRHLQTDLTHLRFPRRTLTIYGADVRREDLIVSVPKQGVSTDSLGFHADENEGNG